MTQVNYNSSKKYTWTGRFNVDKDGFAVEIPKPKNHLNLPSLSPQWVQMQLYQSLSSIRPIHNPDHIWLKDNPEDAYPDPHRPYDKYGAGYDPVLLIMRWLRTGWSKSGLHGRWEYDHANKRKFYTDQAMENLSPFQIQDRAHQNFYFYHPTQQPKKLRRMQLPRIPADINNDSSSDDNDDNPVKQLQSSLASGKFSLKQIQSSTPTPKARPKFSINPKAKAAPSTTSTTST